MCTLHKAGVPDEVTAHRTRSASTSADVCWGIKDFAISNEAGWPRACTLLVLINYYYKKPGTGKLSSRYFLPITSKCLQFIIYH